MKSMRMVFVTLLSSMLLVWAAACAGTNGMTDDKMMDDDDKMMNDDMDKKMDDQSSHDMNGMLSGSDGHHASGKVTIEMGRVTLSNIKVDKVPDGYVFLTKDADYMHGVELGKLKQFSGTVSYELPGGVHAEDYDSVVIWCRKFNVEIGRAYLPGKMM